MLTESQISFFRENGYLAIERLLGDDQLARLRAALDELVEKAQGLTANTKVYDLEPATNAHATVVRRVFNPTENHPVFWEFARSAAVLDVFQALLGPNIEFHHSKINLKAAKEGSEVGWHQDLPFFPHTNSDLAAVMIYLDDSTEENGCLSVVPGSHRLGPLSHFHEGTFIGMVTDDLARVDLDRAVNVPIAAGGATIHHCLTLHGSAPNRSARRRAALIYQYRAADAMQLIPDTTGSIHHGTPVRGSALDAFGVRRVRLEPFVFALPNIAKAERPRSLYELQAEYREKSAAVAAR